MNQATNGKVPVACEELSGSALDWAVGLAALGQEPQLATYTRGGFLSLFTRKWDYVAPVLSGRRYTPSRNWAQAGPLLAAQQITIEPLYCGSKLHGWRAMCRKTMRWDDKGEYVDGSDHMQDGPTAQVALLRCFVRSELGPVVAIPAKLANGAANSTRN